MFNIEIHAQEKKIKSEQKHFAFVCLIPYMKHKRACKGKKQRSEGESEYGVIYSQLKLLVCIYIYAPFMEETACLTLLSQPSQSIFTLISTVCKKN